MLSKEKATLSTSDRPENSVLFSLKELRRLEDERVKAEADARRAQAEAERRAKVEAEQRARDEETRRAREEEERRRRAESEREARQREDRLRVEEAERRARVEGELKLREQQLLGSRGSGIDKGVASGDRRGWPPRRGPCCSWRSAGG